jgi:hypothetical protein
MMGTSLGDVPSATRGTRCEIICKCFTTVFPPVSESSTFRDNTLLPHTLSEYTNTLSNVLQNRGMEKRDNYFGARESAVMDKISPITSVTPAKRYEIAAKALAPSD